jgi:class 3 adenylate cyclase
VLTTFVFADIVGSTELAARLVDREWRNFLEKHDQAGRQRRSRACLTNAISTPSLHRATAFAGARTLEFPIP